MNLSKHACIAGFVLLAMASVSLPAVAERAPCGLDALFQLEGLSSSVMDHSAPLYWGQAECAGLDPKCHSTISAAKKAEVIVIKRESLRTCIAVNSDAVGWVESSAVGPGTPARPVSDAVVGTWTQGLATLVITDEGGRLMISGHATDGRDHFGKIASELSASGDTYAWQNGCRGRLQQVGTRLVVTDDHACGGLNVNFDGVYRRQ